MSRLLTGLLISALPCIALAQETDLEERLRRVEEQLGLTETDLEAALTSGARTGYDDAFFIESADGRQRLTLGGLMQVHGTFFEPGLDGRESEFDLRRMRLEFGGVFDDTYRFVLETKFTADEVELEEAWIGGDLAEDGPLLLVGRMKEPFSLEEMIPRKHLDFPEFSILNQFVPAEDTGVTLFGGSRTGPVEYGLAYYNGTGEEDLNSDKDVAGRFVVRPWSSSGGRLAGFQVGVGATFGEEQAAIAGEELKTEARVPFMTFAPMAAIDGERTRLLGELAWLNGPFAMLAEFATIDEAMTGAGGDADVNTTIWYVAASWVLTGEQKTFDGVQPARAFAPGRGAGARGPGAWQLAARYSELSLDDDLVSAGLVLPTAYPESVSSFDIGINWIASNHASVKLHYLHTVYEDDIVIDGDLRGHEDTLLLQFQLIF